MKVTILTYVESEGSKDYDVVVGQVARALRQGKHTPSVLGVHNDLARMISRLKRRQPDLVFNLVEMFNKQFKGDVEVAGVLDLLDIPYTGGGPAELSLRVDKGLAKKVLAFDQILYPDFAVFSRDRAGDRRQPAVPPVRQAAEGRRLDRHRRRLAGPRRLGADGAGGRHPQEVRRRGAGRGVHRGARVLRRRPGQPRPARLPSDRDGLLRPARRRTRVLDSKAKWAKNSAEYKGTRSVMADLPDELRASLQKVSIDAYRALRVRDYGRVDLRLTETGEIYVIEVNANCYLEQQSEFAVAAAAAGLDYPALINRIADLALERHRGRA